MPQIRHSGELALFIPRLGFAKAQKCTVKSFLKVVVVFFVVYGSFTDMHTVFMQRALCSKDFIMGLTV